MTAKRNEAYAAFLKQKQQIKKSLAADIARELQILGDDVRGLSWFVTSSTRYWQERDKLAA